MKEIELTQGYVAIVDDKDFEYLSQWKWCVNSPVFPSTNRYAIRNVKGKKQILMHRFIIEAKEDDYVCHIDKNTLNNTRENLQLYTASQRRQYSKIRKDSTTKYRGVYKNKKKGRYYAVTYFEGKSKSYGGFKTAYEAAKAHDKIAKKLYGKFATLNFPEDES